jgi:hypothetical protein
MDAIAAIAPHGIRSPAACTAASIPRLAAALCGITRP